MNSLAQYWQNEVQAKHDAEQAQIQAQPQAKERKSEFVRLTFSSGGYTYEDSEGKTVKGTINKDNYKGHVDKLVARATEIAKERKVKLTVSENFSVIQYLSKDFSK